MNGSLGVSMRVSFRCRHVLRNPWLYFLLANSPSAFQTIDVILAWLVAEDDGAKKKISSLLADRDEDLSVIRRTLQGKLLPTVHIVPISLI